MDLDGLEQAGALGGYAQEISKGFYAANLTGVIVKAAKPISTPVKIIRASAPLSKFVKVESLATLAFHGASIANDLLNSAITTTPVGNVSGSVLPTLTVAATRNRNYNIQNARDGLLKVYVKYGKTMASNVEKLYRLETGNFTSLQYRITGTGGMEVHGPAPYYGWNRSFFSKNSQYAPIGIFSIHENKGLSAATKFSNKQVTSRAKQYLIMPSVEAGMMYLSNYIKSYGGNFARWYSTDPTLQKTYRQNVLNQKSTITDLINQTQPNLTLSDNQ